MPNSIKMKNPVLSLLIVTLFQFGLVLQYTFNERAPKNNYFYTDHALQATVKIRTIFSNGDSSSVKSGSGATISADGLILTNLHNIGQAKHIEVQFYSGRKCLAKMIHVDPQLDLALLKVDRYDLAFFQINKNPEPRIGQTVYAIGSPKRLEHSLTSGIVGALNRKIDAIEDTNRIESFIQTDVVINPGFSGGPLFDSMGRLIGINTAILTSCSHFEGYSFAIPVKYINAFLEQVSGRLEASQVKVQYSFIAASFD